MFLTAHSAMFYKLLIFLILVMRNLFQNGLLDARIMDISRTLNTRDWRHIDRAHTDSRTHRIKFCRDRHTAKFAGKPRFRRSKDPTD